MMLNPPIADQLTTTQQRRPLLFTPLLRVRAPDTCRQPPAMPNSQTAAGIDHRINHEINRCPPDNLRAI